MTVEQVARDFVMTMADPERVKEHISNDALVSGGILPRPMPMTEALKVMDGLSAGIPDMKININQIMVNGNQATVIVDWGGTQSGSLSLPMPGLPTIPPSGKRVSVKDIYILTVKGDKVVQMKVDSPVDGGVPGILAQIGVKLPAM